MVEAVPLKVTVSEFRLRHACAGGIAGEGFADGA